MAAMMWGSAVYMLARVRMYMCACARAPYPSKHNLPLSLSLAHITLNSQRTEESHSHCCRAAGYVKLPMHCKWTVQQQQNPSSVQGCASTVPRVSELPESLAVLGHPQLLQAYMGLATTTAACLSPFFSMAHQAEWGCSGLFISGVPSWGWQTLHRRDTSTHMRADDCTSGAVVR
jgi:hypothetical protein